jgi:LPS-assembly protein
LAREYTLRRSLAALLLLFSVARAEPPLSSQGELLQGCPAPPLAELPELPPYDPADPRIEVLTGRAEVDLKAGAAFSEEIRIRRGDGVLTAPGARYDNTTGELSLEGGLEYRDPQSLISGRDARFDVNSNQLRVEGAEFEILTVPSRGSADSITVERMNELKLTDVAYTTCARGDDAWILRASSITIDREEGIATARGARLDFKGVPILYTPWISYPVTNQRKSGFLLPGIGRSETRGFEFQIPYYLNLAPNYDATLTPRYMNERGLELISEIRYLWPGHDGQIDAEYLPNDESTDEDRYLFGWDHESLLGAGWRATVDARAVSDTRYFEDLYGSISASSQTHLERVLDFEFFGDAVSVLARFQDYETLDESLVGDDKPYRRVPQLAARAYVPDGVLGLDWRLDSELSSFDRSTGVTGERLHLNPAIALPLAWRGFRVEPAASLVYTAYSLEDTAPGEDERPSVTAPVLSVDLGSVFERGARGSEGWLQTLEPRVQYVHIPFRDQTDLPVFDTIEPDFNLVQLFRKNRFLGYDRLGDTDQVNIGLTSRFVDAEDGVQYITATVGQTRYFSDQDVTLPGDAPVDDNSSDWLAELGLNLWNNWKVDLGYQWDADVGQSQRFRSRLQYRRDGQHIANLAYRYRRDVLEEIDLSAAWPIADRWSAVARYDYSIFDSEPLERFVGVEYQTCCWGVRLVYRRYLASRTGESDTAIALQLVLKGLTNVGDPADRLLERGILGYEVD